MRTVACTAQPASPFRLHRRNHSESQLFDPVTPGDRFAAEHRDTTWKPYYDMPVSPAGLRSPRSYLYVPANHWDRLDGALARGADALILDLEDAVPVAEKDEARDTVARWLRPDHAPTCELWLRINSTSPEADIGAAVGRGVRGVVVPKAEPILLADVDRLLTARERDLGQERGSLLVLALIETAAGLLSALDLARAPRVAHLGIGEADLAAQLRLHPSEERGELSSLRLQLVVASAAVGIAAPVAPTSTDFRDLETLRRSTEALKRLGFGSRTAIHPAQIPVINEVFSPSMEEVEKARQLVRAYEEAERRGAGAFTDDDGRMVDAAVVRSARDVLALASRSGPPRWC